MTARVLRVAVVGSGPAGAYAAMQLFSANGLAVEVDMFDRLATPSGPVRFGVAPDHPKIKTVTRVFEKLALRSGFRFCGNVEIGADIQHEELARCYDAVLYGTGAAAGRRLNIPDEDLAGSHAATDFVAWYNGHPVHADHALRCAQETVDLLLEDFAHDLLRPPSTSAAELLDALPARGVEVVNYEGWRAIDEHERRLGEPRGRPRIKLVRRNDLLACARTSPVDPPLDI